MTAQTCEDVPVSAEGAGLLMGKECSAVWGRASVSGRAPAPDGVPRASASFSHMGAQVLAYTSLSFPPPKYMTLHLPLEVVSKSNIVMQYNTKHSAEMH